MSVSYDRSRAAWVSVSGCGGSGKVRRLSQSGECASSHRGPCREALPLPGRGIHSRPSIYTRADRQPRRRSSQPHARFRRHPHPPGARPCVDARRRPRGANAHHRRAPRAPSNGHARRGRRRGLQGIRGLRRMATGAGAPPRRAGSPPRRGAPTREGGARRAGDARGREDRAGGPGRGAGDDRHLRLRRGPVAAALRADHRLGAARPSHVRRRGTRWGRSASSPRSTSRWRCGRGTPRSRWCAATRSSGSRPRRRRSPRSRAGRSSSAPPSGSATRRKASSRSSVRRRGAASRRRPAVAARLARPGRPRMGRTIAPRIAGRLARSLLELGGNNGMIVAPTADLDLAVRGHRVRGRRHGGPAVHVAAAPDRARGVADEPRSTGSTAHMRSVAVGDPREPGTLVGPLISERRVHRRCRRRSTAPEGDGGDDPGGERVFADEWPEAYYVRPAIARMPAPDRSRPRGDVRADPLRR